MGERTTRDRNGMGAATVAVSFEGLAVASNCLARAWRAFLYRTLRTAATPKHGGRAARSSAHRRLTAALASGIIGAIGKLD